MIKYLLRHPVSVIMSFFAVFIIGLILYFSIPVSLLPSISIPNITVKANMPGVSSEEIETTIVTPLRRNLLQISGLKEITSKSTDGNAVITLNFDLGTNTDLSFIEVNEKIDASMSSLPKDFRRPKVIKANTTDIPVLYIHMTIKDDSSSGEHEFIEMGQLANNVLCKRIEQLPEIAMVDITGIPSTYIKIEPNQAKMQTLGLGISEIESVITKANVNNISLKVADKQYVYDIRIDNNLHSVDDIAKLTIAHGGRLYPLGELCKIEKSEQEPEGYSLYSGKRAVTLAIIKKTENRIGGMQQSLDDIIAEFSEKYPTIEFNQSQNQVEFLSVTINNLTQNLILGIVLVFVVTLIFIGDFKLSVIIGISVVVSLVTSIIAFCIFGVSINIISLSGMILAVGMMIDNSTIVSENILQIKETGKSWSDSCAIGTTEMITPLLSSMLTTIAVFLPLIFISGIAGAFFADQAFSISAGLFSSYAISIVLLPVIIKLTHGGDESKMRIQGLEIRSVALKINKCLLDVYECAMRHFITRKKVVIIASILVILLCVPVSLLMNIKLLPGITHLDAIATIDWGENINANENSCMIKRICEDLEANGFANQTSASVGKQDFMLEQKAEMQQDKSQIYFKSYSANDLEAAKKRIEDNVHQLSKAASISFSDPDNVFTKMFDYSRPEFEIRLSKSGQTSFRFDKSINDRIHEISNFTNTDIPEVMMDSVLVLKVDREKLNNHKIDFFDVITELEAVFGLYNIDVLQSASEQIPINVNYQSIGIFDQLNERMVKNVPLRYLISMEKRPFFKEIISSSHGQYIPIEIKGISNPEKFLNELNTLSHKGNSDWNINYAGTYFESGSMIRQMIVIFFISIVLMYFILCAQFENFLQPLIVLMEIPIDSFFAFVILWILGYTINIMTAIGIIVTCGIVVNDSILKIDSINDYIRRGFSLDEAIHQAGRRRLRPIIMTSLTTIFAMVPALFGSDLGSEIQRPMAIAMISSMVAGTLVSIFYIPVLYKCLYQRKIQ